MNFKEVKRTIKCKIIFVPHLQPHRVAGLIVEDVAPTDSPRAGSPPHFLQTMLKISLQLRKAADHMGMSTARRLAKETLRESVEVCMSHFKITVYNRFKKRILWRQGNYPIYECQLSPNPQ